MARAASDSKKIVLRISHSHMPDPVLSAMHINSLRLQELVSKKTDNQMEVQIFPANQLGEERVVVEGLKMGTIDMMSSGISIWSNFAPKFGLFDLPFIFPNFAHIRKVVQGPAGEELAQHTLQATGVRVLGYLPSFGFRDVVTRPKEVKKVEDLKGLKLRVLPAPVFIRTFELLGASPTPMAFGEVYTSIQTGVLDGWEHDAPTNVGSKIYEVTKYFSRTEHIHGVCCMTANAKKVDSLPPDFKKALLESAREACDYVFEIAAQKEEDGFKVLREKGMIITTFEKGPAIERVKGLWKEYADKVKASDILAKMIS
jgi:tripartite ATP-independent transporter DctP family solute receptor